MKLLKAISSSILALLILTSSMGVFVDHMVCGMSGEHKLAINTSITACSDDCTPTDDNTVKRSCCDYDSFYFKDDVPATSTETKEKQVVSAFRFIPLNEVFTALNCTESNWFQCVETPDPLPSVRRNILLETFLI